MPKNAINLNSLPLGDMPDGGLIALPGDKITIRDKVIIYETSEKGKKVVKLYRQGDGPQQIQPAAQQQNEKQRRKRSAASPDPDRGMRKRLKTSKGANLQLTTEQELRRMEINAESKRIGAENAVVSQEYAAIKLLRNQNPLDPEISRRTALNKARATELNRRGKENGERRRALKLELNAGIGDRLEDEMQALERTFEHSDDSFSNHHFSGHTKSYSEQNYDENLFRHNPASELSTVGIQYQHRPSYAPAPGCQTHSQSFQTNSVEYDAATSQTLPENKIHPARLLLMNSSSQIPSRISTEPKVLMKVTGENMVPVSRSRMADRQAKASLEGHKRMTELKNVQEEMPGAMGSLAKCQEPISSDTPTNPDTLIISNSPHQQDEKFRPDDAIAWLNANIPLKSESSSQKAVLGEVQNLPTSGRHIKQDTEVKCAETCSTVQSQDTSRITKLGLQHYGDDLETTPDGTSSEFSPNLALYNVNIKKEVSISPTVEGGMGLRSGVKKEAVDEYDVRFERHDIDGMFVKEESHVEYQFAATRAEKENKVIKTEPDEDWEISTWVGDSSQLARKSEFAEETSPAMHVLGERSFNTVAIHGEAMAKEAE